ncbi:MAG: response regulator [Gemmatimonadetes bacterium]|nr:response regulator [Gemmatimonadota bacterium]MBK7922153.1 response regulator [Gemmatimonadota bacterium]MBK9693528.1 response regulator [Gemmatimonadota bacterium]
MPALDRPASPAAPWPLRLALGYGVAYALWAVAMLAGAVERGLGNDLLFIPLYFAAAAAAARAARATDLPRRTARGWWLVAAAWLCSGVAAALMAPLWLISAPRLETLASVLYQGYFPLLLLGLWHFTTFPQGAPARARLAVEGLIAMTGTAILAWYWVFRFEEAALSLWLYLKLVLLVFPGELAVALGAVAILHRPAGDRTGRPFALLSVGTLAAMVADLIYEYDYLIWSAWSGPTGDLLLAFGATLVVSAAWRARTAADGRPLPAYAVGPAIVPHLAIGVVGALALIQWSRPDLEHPALQGLVLGLVALMGLLIVQLVLAQRESAMEAQARAAQDARFRALVQRSSDAILVLDADGTVRYASPAFATMIGDPEGALAGRRLADLVTCDAPGGLAAWLASPGSQPLVRWQAGPGRHIEAVATDRTADPAIGGVVINARDVTERVRLEGQLRQAQKLEVVGRLASSVAHDFNNVLTVITANVHFLRERGAAGGEEELAQMAAAATRGAALARQLTALSRPRAAATTTVDLALAARAIERTLASLLPSSIVTTVTVPEQTAVVRLDEVQAEQVLLNLALNSRDAMPEGGSLAVALDVAAPAGEPAASWARLAVRDSGTGMSSEVLAQALEPFFTTKGGAGGTGLGLYSVQSVVSGAGGRVELRSEPGQGTTVTVWLPLVAPSVPASRPRPAPAVPAGEGSVLVVDDEAAVRRILVRHLTRAGYQVVDCEDGRVALEYLEANPGAVDLALTDLVMPVMSGQELATRISDRWPRLPVLLMSGTPDIVADRHEPWAAQPVIAKPLDLSDVTERIATALRTDAPFRGG